MSSRFFSKRTSWLVLAIATALAYGGMLSSHARRLWSHDYFQFSPVFLLAVLWITLGRIQAGPTPPEGKWRVEPIALGFSLLSLLASLWFWSPLIGAISFLLLGDCLLGGFANARRSWRLLVLLIPLPLGLDRRLIQELQQLSSIQASRFLDAVEVPHLMRGNVLELAEKRFFVEEACSGISSIYLMAAVTALYIVLDNMRFVRSVPLLMSVIWWAIIANSLRIVLIAASHHFCALDLSSGWEHETIGILLMLMGLMGVWATRCFLDFLLGPVGITTPRSNQTVTLTPAILWDAATTSDTSWLYSLDRLPFSVKLSRRRVLLSLTIVLTAFGAVYWWAIAKSALQTSAARDETMAKATALSTVSLERFSELEAVSFKNLGAATVSGFRAVAPVSIEAGGISGIAAKEWIVRTTSGNRRLMVDGPVDGWRNLEQDYVSQGWKIEKTTVQALSKFDPENALVTIRLIQTDGRRIRVHFCSMRSSGELMIAPPSYESGNVTGQIRDHIQKTAIPLSNRNLWGIRLVVEVSGQSLESEVVAERILFRKLILILQRHWKSGVTRPHPPHDEGDHTDVSGNVCNELIAAIGLPPIQRLGFSKLGRSDAYFAEANTCSEQARAKSIKGACVD